MISQSKRVLIIFKVGCTQIILLITKIWIWFQIGLRTIHWMLHSPYNHRIGMKANSKIQRQDQKRQILIIGASLHRSTSTMVQKLNARTRKISNFACLTKGGFLTLSEMINPPIPSSDHSLSFSSRRLLISSQRIAVVVHETQWLHTWGHHSLQKPFLRILYINTPSQIHSIKLKALAITTSYCLHSQLFNLQMKCANKSHSRLGHPQLKGPLLQLV